MKDFVINIKEGVDFKTLKKMELIWSKNENVSLIISEMHPAEVQRIFEFLTPKLPNIFYSSVLETLAERASTPVEILEVLFDSEDEGCQLSICMRDDLTDNLLVKCRNSPFAEVREHFIRRQKHILAKRENAKEK